jgi:hypothetical protein
MLRACFSKEGIKFLREDSPLKKGDRRGFDREFRMNEDP